MIILSLIITQNDIDAEAPLGYRIEPALRREFWKASKIHVEHSEGFVYIQVITEYSNLQMRIPEERLAKLLPKKDRQDYLIRIEI